MNKRYKIKFLVEMTTEVTLNDEELLEDVISNIDIPESSDVKYVADSYETLSVTDENDNEIDVEDHDFARNQPE